jgi:hypothetical protein
VFNEALKSGAHPSIEDLDSAMQYCYDALSTGGLCDHALPQTYQLYKARHSQECGEATYIKGPIFENPYNRQDNIYIAEATYTQVLTYKTAYSSRFMVFQACVVLIWLVATCQEIYDLIVLAQFIRMFPVCDGVKDTGLSVDTEERTVRILAVCDSHRAIIFISLVIRGFLTVFILKVGLTFLLADTDYLNMLLNAVALVFVFEIDELLYSALGRSTTKNDIDNTAPLEFPSISFTNPKLGRFIDKDFWGMFILPFLVLCLVAHHALFTTKPVVEALLCACQQEGEYCQDAVDFNTAWYDDYWTTTFPAALKAVQ